MRKRRTKLNYRRIVLRLPDLDHSKMAVLNSLPSPGSRRVYQFAINQFITWYCSEPRLAFNRIVVGNGDVVHSALEQLFIELFRIGIAVREIETAKEPFLRASAVARVNMKVAPAHIYVPRFSLCWAIQSW